MYEGMNRARTRFLVINLLMTLRQAPAIYERKKNLISEIRKKNSNAQELISFIAWNRSHSKETTYISKFLLS